MHGKCIYWFKKLAQVLFTIVHKKGKGNKNFWNQLDRLLFWLNLYWKLFGIFFRIAILNENTIKFKLKFVLMNPALIRWKGSWWQASSQQGLEYILSIVLIQYLSKLSSFKLRFQTSFFRSFKSSLALRLWSWHFKLFL